MYYCTTRVHAGDSTQTCIYKFAFKMHIGWGANQNQKTVCTEINAVNSEGIPIIGLEHAIPLVFIHLTEPKDLGQKSKGTESAEKK